MPPASESSSDPLLHASGLRFAYAQGGFSLSLPELRLHPSETLLLSGPSGAGKTTLLRLLSGLLPFSAGTLAANPGVRLEQLSPAALRSWRLRHAGLIFQDFALLDYLTAAENILLPARFLSLPEGPWDALRQSLPGLAERLDMAHLLDRPCSLLSQGERQRVAILRALITTPSLIFADEPTASLDTRRRDQVLAILDDHVRSSGAALILVTHDPDVAARYARHLSLEDLTRS